MGDLIERLRDRKLERRGYEADNLRTIPPEYGRGEFRDYVPDPDCQEAADELTRLRAALSASTAREAVYQEALRNATKIAWPWIDKHTGNPRLSWEQWERICCDIEAAISIPSPGVEKLLAVVEAARVIDASSAVDGHVPIAALDELHRRIATLDAAEGKKT